MAPPPFPPSALLRTGFDKLRANGKPCTDLCDAHPDLVRVVEPLFTNYGGKICFGGEIVTVKCHEDNSVVKETAGTPGHGKVMVVDGGASMRRALLGDMIAENAVKNRTRLVGRRKREPWSFCDLEL